MKLKKKKRFVSSIIMEVMRKLTDETVHVAVIDVS